MRIVVIGAGYVGLVSAACFSEFGMDVICVDNNPDKISALQKGEIPIYEPHLDELVARNMMAGRLGFSLDLSSSVAEADVVFIAVGTPSRRGDGHADLTYVFEAAKDIAKTLKNYTVVVTKSTVPVGTGRKVYNIIKQTNPNAEFDIASNPEFLREGAAIDDFMRPDRVIIGAENERALEILRKLYQPLYRIEVPIMTTDLETAELTKYAANAFLALKVTFINEIADLCEKLGANIQDVAKGIGLDGRIGKKFLNTGPGYGGSCFPKDTKALVRTAQNCGSPVRIIETVVDINEARPFKMVKKIKKACDNNLTDKKIAILGLTFKPNTDDMRDSPSLKIIPALLKEGANIIAFDPKGLHEAQKYFGDTISYANDVYDALDGADAVVLMTEWNEFRALNLTLLKTIMKKPLMIDLRNVYNLEDMQKAGITYVSVGRDLREYAEE